MQTVWERIAHPMSATKIRAARVGRHVRVAANRIHPLPHGRNSESRQKGIARFDLAVSGCYSEIEIKKP